MDSISENKKITQNLRYLVMPDFIYQDNQLTDISRRVYCFIHSFKGDSFYFSNGHMAEMFSCSEWSISKAVKQLEELNYIHTIYKIKADGGKIRFIKDAKVEVINTWFRNGVDPISEISSTQSPKLARPKENDNKINDNTLSKDKGDKVSNRYKIDFCLKEFERVIGHAPVDSYQKPRQVAWNLVRRLEGIKKKKSGIDSFTVEQTSSMIEVYFDWLRKKDWIGNIQKLETVASKTPIFEKEVLRQ